MDDDDDDDDDDDATLDNVQQMVFKAALLRVGPHAANLPERRREEHDDDKDDDDDDDTLSSAFIINDDKDDDTIVSAEYESLCGDAMQRWMFRGKSFVGVLRSGGHVTKRA